MRCTILRTFIDEMFNKNVAERAKAIVATRPNACRNIMSLGPNILDYYEIGKGLLAISTHFSIYVMNIESHEKICEY